MFYTQGSAMANTVSEMCLVLVSAVTMSVARKLMLVISVAAKGDTEPERNETRNKVDEDRKHEYPSLIILILYFYFVLVKQIWIVLFVGYVLGIAKAGVFIVCDV